MYLLKQNKKKLAKTLILLGGWGGGGVSAAAVACHMHVLGFVCDKFIHQANTGSQ
jgi:hypothetical protein